MLEQYRLKLAKVGYNIEKLEDLIDKGLNAQQVEETCIKILSDKKPEKADDFERAAKEFEKAAKSFSEFKKQQELIRQKWGDGGADEFERWVEEKYHNK